MFRPLGGHLQVKLRNLFLYHFFCHIVFHLHQGSLLHYKSIKEDGTQFLVLSVCKIINISQLWPRYMWLVLIAGLPSVGGVIVLCVFNSLLLFLCFCWFPVWVFRQSLVFMVFIRVHGLALIWVRFLFLLQCPPPCPGGCLCTTQHATAPCLCKEINQ